MSLNDSRFLKACRKEQTACTPIWLMRQAGRYMSEYRELRKKYSLLTLCKTPELATEVTMQPIRAFALDAAIIFADILLPIEPMGLQLEFAKGEGPVISNSITTAKDVERLHPFDPRESLSFVMDAIRLVVRELGDIPLIGFAGAPFTVASYMIEGGYSRHFIKTKKLFYQEPRTWHSLMEKLSDVTANYLQAQAEAGASVVQLFDSWAGILSPQDYREFVLPHSKRILQSLKVPTIHFSTGTSSYLNLISEAGGDVIGVDWRIELDRAWAMVPDRAIQGNLDPCCLLKSPDALIAETRRILKQANGRRGHIFNLGHGVFPETPTENVQLLVEEVHKYK
jgi:uroporphyrinogen decarboxylase